MHPTFRLYLSTTVRACVIPDAFAEHVATVNVVPVVHTLQRAVSVFAAGCVQKSAQAVFRVTGASNRVLELAREYDAKQAVVLSALANIGGAEHDEEDPGTKSALGKDAISGAASAAWVNSVTGSAGHVHGGGWNHCVCFI